MREILFTITKAQEGLQIRDFLRDFGVSGSLLTKLKNTPNGITLNSSFAKTIETLHQGDELRIKIENNGNMPTPKANNNIKICYEDEDILVIDKPPLMPVHESRNHLGDTLSNFVAYHIIEENKEDDRAFRAVFRLDRDTSGLVLVAKNELAASKLSGKIDKDYYAVVKGEISKAGTINAPIARCGTSIIKRKVDQNGETAITHYQPISTKNGYTLLKINLETGRTHQIRVHFSHLGYPLVGDTLYGDCNEKINRQALHCKEIRFTHPITNKAMSISTEFPKDMACFI